MKPDCPDRIRADIGQWIRRRRLGDFAGHKYLLIDRDGAVGFGGQDAIVEITGYTGSFNSGSILT